LLNWRIFSSEDFTKANSSEMLLEAVARVKRPKNFFIFFNIVDAPKALINIVLDIEAVSEGVILELDVVKLIG